MTGVLPPDSAALPTSSAPRESLASNPNAKKPKHCALGAILVVEDNDAVRAVVQLGLEAQGFVVFSANLPSQAMELFDNSDIPITLLLTDVVMPELSGRQLFERLCRRRPGLKVLYMSGYPDDILMLHGISLHEFALIRKPFAPKELGDKIREILMGE